MSMSMNFPKRGLGYTREDRGVEFKTLNGQQLGNEVVKPPGLGPTWWLGYSKKKETQDEWRRAVRAAQKISRKKE